MLNISATVQEVTEFVEWPHPDTRVLVMAGGKGKSWAPMGYRALLSVGSETLIDRIRRQVRGIYNVDPVILMTSGGQPFGYDYQYSYCMGCKTPIETMDTTRDLWGDLTLVLQGDTFYPDVAMSLIVRKDFFCYGRGAEIYALKFYREYHALVSGAIRKAVSDTRSNGRLWCIYRAFEGYPVDMHKLGPNFYTFKDEDSPTDFDRMEQYDAFTRQDGRQ